MEATIPYDSNGQASISGQRPVNGQDTDAAQINVPLNDIQSMLSQVLLRSGVAPMTGNLNMNGFKIVGSGEPTANSDPVTLEYFNSILSQSGAITGEVKAFRRKTAPSGWVKENGGTIGNASSGATNRANADTEALFTMLWGEFSNTELPIQTSTGVASTRGASASADFAANKRMPLFDSRTRFLRGADDGLAFDATLTVGLSQDDVIKNHVHPGNTTASNVTLGGISALTDNLASGTTTRLVNGGSIPVSIPALPFTTNSNTAGNALETRPRSSVVLYCIKL
jgi:hypothetical protein